MNKETLIELFEKSARDIFYNNLDKFLFIKRIDQYIFDKLDFDALMVLGKKPLPQIDHTQGANNYLGCSIKLGDEESINIFSLKLTYNFETTLWNQKKKVAKLQKYRSDFENIYIDSGARRIDLRKRKFYINYGILLYEITLEEFLNLKQIHQDNKEIYYLNKIKVLVNKYK